MAENVTERHPAGFKYVFFGELAERASYYGMLCLLTSYMLSVLGFEQGKAGFVSHTFKAMAYILPVLGGYVADRWLGKFKTVMVFSVPYVLGHFIIGEWRTESGLYLALVLLAGGSGAIKPNVYPLMALMYEREKKSAQLLDRASTYFYAAINIGAAISMLTLPEIRTQWGYGTAFMAPTVLMIVALIVFALGRKHYPTEELQTVIKTPEEKRENRQVLIGLSGIFLCYIPFWMAYDQQNTTWVFFAKDMDLLGLKEPDTIQWLNPALIILFAMVSGRFWGWLERQGINPRPTDKMSYGLLLTSLCMMILTIAGLFAKTSQVSLLWEVAAYVVLGLAEMCLSVVGLSFFYKQAPAHMKSQVMAVFLSMAFVGNLIAGSLTWLYTSLGPAAYFGMLSAILATTAAIFTLVVAKKFNSRTL